MEIILLAMVVGGVGYSYYHLEKSYKKKEYERIKKVVEGIKNGKNYFHVTDEEKTAMIRYIRKLEHRLMMDFQKGRVEDIELRMLYTSIEDVYHKLLSYEEINVEDVEKFDEFVDKYHGRS